MGIADVGGGTHQSRCIAWDPSPRGSGLLADQSGECKSEQLVPTQVCDQNGGANYESHSMPSYIPEKPFFPRPTLDMTVRDHTAILFGRCMRERSCCGIRV